MTITDQARSGVIGAAGTATLTFQPTGGQNWVVSQVSISAPTVGASATCVVNRDGYLITPMVPQGDAAAGDPPIVVRNGQRLTVVWGAAVVGAGVQALVIYDDGN